MKKIITLLLVIAVIVSCKQPVPIVVAAKAPVDSLITTWTNGWNNHDSAAVGKLFSTDALLIDDNLVADNTDKIAVKWISPNINVVHNFKSTKLQDWSTIDRAGYTGKYEFDAIVNDSVVARPNGFFTINWIKTGDAGWKITTAHIHGFLEKK